MRNYVASEGPRQYAFTQINQRHARRERALKSPWQVADNRWDAAVTSLSLVRALVAQQSRNAGRQETQKSRNKMPLSRMDWMPPKPPPRREEEDKGLEMERKNK